MNRAFVLIPLVFLALIQPRAEERRLTRKEAQEQFDLADDELNEAWAELKSKMPTVELAGLKEDQ